MRPRQRRTALLAAFATLLGCTAGCSVAASDFTLVGDLQRELGCSSDWDATCARSGLHLTDGAWTTRLTVPAGSWQVKVAGGGTLQGSWGQLGAADGANIPLVLAGTSTVEFSFDPTSHRLGVRPVHPEGGITASDYDRALSPAGTTTSERFYFVMADRFANGDASNDTGGLTGTREVTGFDPSDKGFYHGGDLKGLTSKLDYIEGLGTTAIWLTPSFTNRAVQGTGADSSAGYHGYWITDFTTIDPHLGTNEDMSQLIRAAHERGMKVYFDIITNHTADVLAYADGSTDYVPETDRPWLDAAGQPFDDDDVADSPDFPALTLDSFAKQPVFPTEADRTARTPAWLNDPTMYHNRGDTTWEGESALDGDFSGLDDLFTERPAVLDGMSDIYRAWIAMGVDGFRIDTVKHVNLEFWQAFIPRMQEAARTYGNDDFFMFGEVFDADPTVLSGYTTTGKLPATLDFGFQAGLLEAVSGQSPTSLATLWASDDLYTDADSSAYSLPTFTGNHDMGRLGMLLTQRGFTGDELVTRLSLANALMYATRGQPVTYYGDEQGFVGLGGDKDARQDLFATQVGQYASEQLADGTTMGSVDHDDTSGTLYRATAAAARLRAEIPALATGAQIVRQVDADAGILALSRIDRETNDEVLVVANTSTDTRTASFTTWSPDVTYDVASAGEQPRQVRSDASGNVTLDVPPLSLLVLAPSGPMAIRTSEAQVDLLSPGEGARANGMVELLAAMPADRFSQVTFWWRPTGGEWASLGTDDTPTATDDGRAGYRVVVDASGVADGSLLEVRVVAQDSGGRVSVDGASFTVGQAG